MRMIQFVVIHQSNKIPRQIFFDLFKIYIEKEFLFVKGHQYQLYLIRREILLAAKQ